jgi:hypothetical protein
MRTNQPPGLIGNPFHHLIREFALDPTVGSPTQPTGAACSRTPTHEIMEPLCPSAVATPVRPLTKATAMYVMLAKSLPSDRNTRATSKQTRPFAFVVVLLPV